MTQTVVHLFEVVNVDHDASERVVAPRGPRGLRGDGLSVWMGCSLHIQDRVASVEEARHVAERRENLRKEPRDEGSTIRRTAAGLASRIASSRLTNSMPRPISRIVKSRATGRRPNSSARCRPQTRATVERENATGKVELGGVMWAMWRRLTVHGAKTATRSATCRRRRRRFFGSPGRARTSRSEEGLLPSVLDPEPRSIRLANGRERAARVEREVPLDEAAPPVGPDQRNRGHPNLGQGRQAPRG